MKRKLLENRPGSWAAIVAVLVLFVCVGCLLYRDADGQDLASSYVGARLLAEGQAQHLFSYDPQDFSEIGDDDVWVDAAQDGLAGDRGRKGPDLQHRLSPPSLRG